MAITKGDWLHPLREIEGGRQRATWFLPSAEPHTARKQWIFGSMRPSGAVAVDEGACKALAMGKSLLPAGVTAVEGEFERGDCILIRSPEGRPLGRGLAAYSSEDARRISRRRSSEIEGVLGYSYGDELIHRDDMVVDG